MTGLSYYLGRARELPPREAARKALEFVTFRTGRRWRKWTYRLMPDPASDRSFARRIGMGREAAGDALFVGDHAVLPVRWATVSVDPAAIAALRAIGAMALEHRFDLLGSGPVRVDYCVAPAGVEGHRYRMPPGEEAEHFRRAAMEALLPGSTEGYDPIDWQVDFKSGYRWSERSWSADLRYGHLNGVDVKVPWELSRFQHLGALGLLHRVDPESPEAERAAAEFVSQITDWISANPVRHGVNWVCTMDVAIRAVNWLLALELFRDSPRVTPPFRWLLAKSLYTHGLHIERHLEYSRQAGSNHYLANVVGLICIAAALPEVPESDRWLAWSLQELASEMDRQVLPDGVDHEGSSGYHFLVAEMFYLGTLIALRAGRHRRDRLRAVPPHRVAHPRAPAYRTDGVLRLDRPELFPDSYFDRLLGMAEFGAALSGAGWRVPLYGDHDSGRLYKLTPTGRPGPDGVYREDFRDRRYLAAVAGLLFDRADLCRVGGAFAADATLLTGDLDPGPVVEAVRTARANGGVPARVVRRQSADGGGVSFYPDGGIAVIRWGPLHVVITLGTVSAGASGGHYHNDLLSFELHWDGVDVVVDSGTYLYTPSPELRNGYRSVRAHNTVAVDGVEQRVWPASPRQLFTVLRDATVDTLEVGDRSFAARCRYAGVVHERRWEWGDGGLSVEDRVEAAASARSLTHFAPGVSMERLSDPAHRGEFRLDCGGGVALDLSLDGPVTTEIGHAAFAPAYGELLPQPLLVTTLHGGWVRASIGPSGR